MRCFHCALTIGGKVRWVIISGERVPFHQPTVMFDCANEYLKLNPQEHQADDTYADRFRSQLG